MREICDDICLWGCAVSHLLVVIPCFADLVIINSNVEVIIVSWNDVVVRHPRDRIAKHFLLFYLRNNKDPELEFLRVFTYSTNVF